MSIKITLRKWIFPIGSHIRHSKTEEIHQSKYSLQLQNLSVDFTKKIVFACMTSLNSAGSDGRYSRHGMVPRPEVYVLAKA